MRTKPLVRTVEQPAEAPGPFRLWWLMILASSLLAWAALLLGAELAFGLLA